MCWIKERREELIKIGTAFMLAEGAKSEEATTLMQRENVLTALENALLRLKASPATLEEVAEDFGKSCAAIYKGICANRERWVNPFDDRSG